MASAFSFPLQITLAAAVFLFVFCSIHCSVGQGHKDIDIVVSLRNSGIDPETGTDIADPRILPVHSVQFMTGKCDQVIDAVRIFHGSVSKEFITAYVNRSQSFCFKVSQRFSHAADGSEEPGKTEPAKEEDPDEGLLVIGEKAEGDHVYYADRTGEHHLCVSGKCGFPFFGRMIRDCLDGTDTAMNQAYTLRVMELAVEAQRRAKWCAYRTE